MGTIIFACTNWREPGGRGRFRREYFMPPFKRAMARHGFHVRRHKFPALFLMSPPHSGSVIVFLVSSDGDCSPIAKRVEARAIALYGENRVFHRPDAAALLNDKVETNRVLTKSGVLMPRLVNHVADIKVFSNERFAAGSAVQVLERGTNLDPRRYNTEFIDTTHEFRGKAYFVSLRAMCVGRRPYAIYARARPAVDGNPSVHAEDTPLDADLLNYLHETLVLPNNAKIETICESIGERFGLGFYAHDFLPERDTGNIFLAETNLKIGNAHYSYYLAPIRHQLMFKEMLSGIEIERAADILLEEARYFGAFDGR